MFFVLLVLWSGQQEGALMLQEQYDAITSK